MTNLKKYGNWALIAGAGEGLGFAYAELLIDSGFNLIIIDHKLEKLEKAKKELSKRESAVLSVHMDLSDLKSLEILKELITEHNVRLLVYNAAYGPVKKFTDHSKDELDQYVHLNSEMPMKLAYSFAKIWLHKEAAGFIGMSSLAGLRGTSLVAPYSASKAFMWTLMEALYFEFFETNLDYMACIAGSIDTPHYRSLNAQKAGIKPKDLNPRQVAREALQELGKKATHIPGSGNRWTHWFLTKILTHNQATLLTNKTMRKMFSHQWGRGYQK